MANIRKRLSFWALTASYPISAMLLLKSKWLESPSIACAVVLTYTALIIWLALDASLRIKIRTAQVGSTVQEIGDLMLDFIVPLLTVAFAQVLVRDVGTIGSEPEFLKIFGYLVGRDANHALQWMGSVWTILIAYCIKYHWDAIVKAMETATLKSEGHEDQTR